MRVVEGAALVEALAPAAALLRAGGLVAFPTETVYGLGANALDAVAVRRIFEAKGRPAEDPLIVHVLGLAEAQALSPGFPELARRLAEAFWPGPLTLVVPRGPSLPAAVSAGLDSVALRAPSHPVARALLRAAGVPVAAPSANPFGRISPTRAEHVLADLGDRIDLVIDGGPAEVGVESTVVDCRGEQALLLRPGGVSLEALRAVVGEVRLAGAGEAEAGMGPQRSPGTMLRHYAPRARLVLVVGEAEQVGEAIGQAALGLAAKGRRVGLLLAEEDRARWAGEEDGQAAGGGSGPAPEQTAGPPGGPRWRVLGSLRDLEAVARALFGALRELDAAGVDCILARDFGGQGMGLALRDRLSRAAEGRVLRLESQEGPSAAAARIERAVEGLERPRAVPGYLRSATVTRSVTSSPPRRSLSSTVWPGSVRMAM